MSLHLSRYSFIGDQLRYFFYKKSINKVGKGVKFSFGVVFSHKNIEIGDNVRFGPYNTVGLVDFGDNVLIGQYVNFLSGKNQHYFNSIDTPINQQTGVQERITIGNDCWIGAGSTLMCNIGKKSVIGAGTIVVKPIDNYSIVVGNPGKVIRSRI
ncbi:acyltransferase [Tenacibaculum ovolyticum]|uniref:acyltransferase n=1 Tax=Tenacibaculum ovolyticum TaxID=104270 RepID=UPI003BAC7449